jgi:Na+/melibiose symporter-like transporter
MILLWTAVSALSLAWFVGDALLGLMVAPVLFHHATEQGIGTGFAGLVFGDLLGRWATIAGLGCVIPIVCLLAALAGRRLKQLGWRSAVLPLSVVVLVLAMHITTVTVVKQGLDTAAELREQPDPERAERFRTSYHARSRVVFGTEMLIALSLAVGAAMMASRSRRS